MKKIYALIASMFLLFTSNVEAQRGWDYDATTLEEIIPGEDHFYVIQQGFGPANAKPIDGFLNSGDPKVVTTVDHSCIYNFIEVGQKETNGETFKIFILKNVANGKYICETPEKYTGSPIEAFQFTARKAVSKEVNEEVKADWYQYSNAINGGKCPNAEGVNWVFCKHDQYKFMAFNNNPGWSTGYVTANNWRVFAAKEREMNAYEKFLATYDFYFTNFDIDQSFIVGTNPGCVSQELYDEVNAVYKEATNKTAIPDLPDSEYNAINQKVQDLFKKVEEESVPVAPGYFVIQNVRQGFLTNNTVGYCDGTNELPEAWTIDNVKYVWQVETSEEGKFYFKNVGSTLYLGNKNNEFKMTAEPKAKYTAPHRIADLFYLNDGGGYINSKQKVGTLTHWADLEGSGNHWKFYAVDATAIDTLKNMINQNNLNKKLGEAVVDAELTLKGLETKSGLTMDGYYAPNATGLVNRFDKCNASDTREGSTESAPFDRDVETFYHTMWSKDAPAGERHWGQIDFGEPVQDLYIKMTKRVRNVNSNPTKIALLASENDDLEASDWEEVLFEDTVIYTYQTILSDTIADSTTYIQKIHLQRPAQYVRFTATETVLNKYWNEGGPTWNIAELRFYKAENCVHNNSFDLIPKEIINALNEVIAKAKAEVEANAATQATADELQAAIDAMWEAYPNPTALNNALNNANYRLEVAEESEGNMPEDWGFYHKGAKAEFQKALETISTAIKNEEKALSLEDIKKLETQLNEAVTAFNAQLIVPTDGIYHIICAAGFNENSGNEYAEEGAYIASANADVNTPAVWGYKGDAEIETRWNTLWKIERGSNGGFSFKNLANGLYLDNPYEGLTEEEQDSIQTTTQIHFSTTPKYITLEAAAEAGKFMLTLKQNRFINASGQGKVGYVGRPMAIWNDFKNGNRSRYIFEEVTSADFTAGSYKVNCAAGTSQIMCFPIELKGVFTGALDGAYKVLGTKDGKVQLELYEVNEVIPAGTPFIVTTQDNEDLIELVPTVSTLDGLSNIEYNYEPIVQNGLVSAPQTMEIGAGYGLIFQDKVIATVGGETIAAGTGFFNNELKATTEDGTRQLELKDVISGEGTGTAIEDIIAPTTTNSDIYTMTGVKVRNNTSTKNLPRGIYIVSGKKIFVK